MPPHDTAPAAPSGRAPEVAAQPLTAMQRFRKLKKAVQLRDHVQTNEFVKAAHYLAGVLVSAHDAGWLLTAQQAVRAGAGLTRRRGGVLGSSDLHI